LAGLKPVLAGILARPAEERGAAGLAVAASTSEPEVVWTPSSLRAEPVFLAYSITKTFTAVLLLQLVDEGRLDLDDSLARWFPGIAHADRISVRRLLNHTAGIPDYGGLGAYHDGVRATPSAPWSFERFAAETFDKGLRFEPGTGCAYSNPGYMLLKRIAEEVGERRYAELIADRIVRPLDLRRTFVPEAVADLAGLAPALSRELSTDCAPREVREHYHPGWVSHGVVASTPSEVARVFAALFAARLVSPHALREMTALVPVPGQPPDPRHRWGTPSYGLGIMGDLQSRWGRLWGHNGGGPGYRTSAFHAPDLNGVSVCAMCAEEGSAPAEELLFAVLDAIGEGQGGS
jgi:D-alanyl-D-alanine carboxypeptidase